MTIATTAVTNAFAGTAGGLSGFTLAYQIDDAADLLVTRVLSDGSEETLLLDVHYSVEGAGRLVIPGLGTSLNPVVTLLTGTSPVVTGQTLYIERLVEPVQETSLQNLGAAYPAVVEATFDRVTEILQQFENLLGSFDQAKTRVLKLPTREPIGSSAFDALSNRIENMDDPINNQDAVTKAFLYAVIGSITSGPTDALFLGVFTTGTRPPPSTLNYNKHINLKNPGDPSIHQVCGLKSDGTTYEWITYGFASPV